MPLRLTRRPSRPRPEGSAAACGSATRPRPTGPTWCSTWSPSLDGKATIDWRTKGLSTSSTGALPPPAHPGRRRHGGGGHGARRALRAHGEVGRAARRARGGGPAPDPLAVVVSARLDLPADLPLLNEPEQQVVIATGSDASLPDWVASQVAYERIGDDLPLLMARLRETRHPLGRLRGRSDAQLVPVRRRPRRRAVAHAQPEARRRRRGADDRRGPRAGRAGRAGAGLDRRGRRRSVHALARRTHSLQKPLQLALRRARLLSMGRPMASAPTQPAGGSRTPARRRTATSPSSSSRT